jgi:hypothetical protein
MPVSTISIKGPSLYFNSSKVLMTSPSSFQALNRLFSVESESENPEMVAGRLEIRVVSSPLPERDSRLATEIKVVPDKVQSGKSGLELLEETFAKKVSYRLSGR